MSDQEVWVRAYCASLEGHRAFDDNAVEEDVQLWATADANLALMAFKEKFNESNQISDADSRGPYRV